MQPFKMLKTLHLAPARLRPGLLQIWFASFLCAAGFTGAAPGPRTWDDYHPIMWMGDSVWKDPTRISLVLERLKEMGVTTGMVHGDSSPQPLVESGFPYYVENMVNRGLCLKWNSKVRDWDSFVTQWTKDGRPDSALIRDYCLDDSKWLTWARDEMRRLAQRNRSNSPLAYDIRDELSTTISANPFDYDFSPLALVAFREWLSSQYGNLEALNTGWETTFKTWEEVRPFTTDQIKNRMSTGIASPRGNPDWQALQRLRFNPTVSRSNLTRWNFSPWADFRTYMDVALARTLNDLRVASRTVDPETPVGVEGTQMPHAFGGYDLWRLSQALDWVEPYDIGNAREIFGSFMTGRPILSTVFERETDRASRRLWHLLLEGDRGCIIWWSEDCLDWNSPDLRLTDKGKELAPVMKDMTSDLARLFLRARRVRDPIFLHYSQPSIQVHWLLESTVDGPSWIRRFSSYESSHNRLARVRNGWLKLFQDLGFSPQFISSETLESGALRTNGTSVLVLPGSLALSAKESDEISRFLGSGSGTARRCMVGSDTPGCFDEHGKLRANPILSPVSPLLLGTNTQPFAFLVSNKHSSDYAGAVEEYPSKRLRHEPELSWLRWLGPQLESLELEVKVDSRERVRIHRFHVADAILVAFERNIDYHMSEDLKQAGGNEALEQSGAVEAKLLRAMHVYDLRKLHYLGLISKVQFNLSPWQPSLFALTEKPLPLVGLIDSLTPR